MVNKWWNILWDKSKEQGHNPFQSWRRFEVHCVHLDRFVDLLDGIVLTSLRIFVTSYFIVFRKWKPLSASRSWTNTLKISGKSGGCQASTLNVLIRSNRKKHPPGVHPSWEGPQPLGQLAPVIKQPLLGNPCWATLVSFKKCLLTTPGVGGKIPSSR